MEVYTHISRYTANSFADIDQMTVDEASLHYYYLCDIIKKENQTDGDSSRGGRKFSV